MIREPLICGSQPHRCRYLGPQGTEKLAGVCVITGVVTGTRTRVTNRFPTELRIQQQESQGQGSRACPSVCVLILLRGCFQSHPGCRFPYKAPGFHSLMFACLWLMSPRYCLSPCLLEAFQLYLTWLWVSVQIDDETNRWARRP
jgi:hypothetical protein